jgi:putative endopeptidase
MPAMKFSPYVLAAALLAACATVSAPPPQSGLDLAGFDQAARPQDDLFRYAGGHWLDTTQIPADLPNYGAFTKLDEDARANVRGLIEGTAQATSQAQEAGVAVSTTSWTPAVERGLAALAPIRPHG